MFIYYSVMVFFRLVDINEYMAGTINRVKKVDTNIPPTTATPMAIRPWAPSPVAYTNGTKPRMVDTLVIKIGRRRWVADERIASGKLSPDSCR